MTDLKTLKDLTPYTEFKHSRGKVILTDKLVSFEELKAEAIKWVKYFRSTSIPSKYTMENDFTAFFNLTEEDLKMKDKDKIII